MLSNLSLFDMIIMELLIAGGYSNFYFSMLFKLFSLNSVIWLDWVIFNNV
jgi:hypothetical protein